MAATKPVWGIDLGQCALKAIRLRLADDRVEAVEHAYIEHKKILSAPDADRNALIDAAMKKFREDHDLSGEPIVVGVPGQNTLARFTKLPPVDKKRIPELIKFEAQQQIPFDMDEVIWDYQVFDKKDAVETEVGIFAMRRELLREHLQFLSGLNIEATAVQSSPLALYNALKYDGMIGDEPVVVIDIGARNTDLMVADGSSLWSRNIPIGGNQFTEVLLKTFKLSFRKAENLKREAAKSKYARQIFQAMRPVFADLVAEVQRSIGFYTSSRRGTKLNKILAMGNAFKLPGMQKFLQQNLSMEVVRPSTFKRLNAAEARNAPELMDHLTSFSVAYGLALQGLGQGAITSNLLPVEIAKQVVWKKKTPWFYGAAACLFLSSLVVQGRNFLDQGSISQNRGNQSKPNFSVGKTPEGYPQPDPRALQIIQNGSSQNTPWELANEAIAVGQHMQSVMSQIKSMNDAQIQEAKSLADLRAEKTVWPQILDMIFSSLPRADRELTEAIKQGPEAYKKLVESDPAKYERSKRELVFIDQMEVKYSADVLTELRNNSGGSPAAGGMMGSPQKGFLITVRGRTPNEGGPTFLTNTFLSNLKTAGPEYKNVYIAPDSVDILQCPKIKEASTSGNRGRTGGGPNTGMSGPGSSSMICPVTGENIGDDYVFDIIFAAVIGPRPQTNKDAANPSGPQPQTPTGFGF